MRTDLITAWFIYEWVEQNFPDIAADWSFEVDDQVKAMAQTTQRFWSQVRNLQTAVAQHIWCPES